MIPLSSAEIGEEAVIRRIDVSQEEMQQLRRQGLEVGRLVTVAAVLKGDCILRVRDTRVAIHSELAQKIMISREDRPMKTLKDAPIGSTVRVVRVHGAGAIRRRIMDMGITRGVEIRIRKVAPLGDPLEITVRGYELSLRKEDAEDIEIE